MKHAGGLNMQKGETLESLLTRHGSQTRPKSNFSNAKYLPNGVIYTDVTVEQAVELLGQNPSVFMHNMMTEPGFTPVVKGQQIAH